VRVSLHTPPPEALAVGAGNVLPLQGRCQAPSKVTDLRVRVGDNESPAVTRGIPPPGELVGTCSWWALVPITRVERSKRARIDARVRPREGAEHIHELGSVRLDPGGTAPGAANGGASDLVAICLATHDPPLDLLSRQVESIREQTHRNWICIVSDDGSPPWKWRELVGLVGTDERFRLDRSARRRGFYLNFERALRSVPPDAAYVAFADQDDRWDGDKLEALISALGRDDVLAHSDARVVDADGALLSPTFWPRGRPDDARLEELLLTSAVTGASCLFRRRALDCALPFPPPVGAAYHDRWIALICCVLGGVAYVDRPLYDYVQHPGTTLGHSGVTEPSRFENESRAGALRRRLRHLRQRRFHPNWRAAYDEVLIRSVQEAEVLRLRLGELMSPGERRAVARIARLPHSPSAQAYVLIRYVARAPRRLPGREGSLARGIAWRRLVRMRTLVHSVFAPVRP
jgi:glycosyltransferase involved in cell wall biosynthesis